MTTKQELEAVTELVRSSTWGGTESSVRFLAAGEYNRNYQVSTSAGELVVRINTGSQLDIDDQIEYEYSVLESVADSGHTPRPIALGPRSESFPRGYLVMEWLPGRALQYTQDSLRAADLFAAVHVLAVPESPSRPLITQPNPILDIVEESGRLLSRYPDHPRADLRRMLERYREEIAVMGENLAAEFAAEMPVIANTEVNSGNFLVTPDSISLVDWEKAVITPRYQDLGHFLVETTTRWKTDYVFDTASRRAVLAAYRTGLMNRGAVAPPLDTLARLTRALERTIVLRGLSWCYMAYYEYSGTDRPIRNEHTARVIRSYLDEAEALIARAAAA